MKSFTTLLPALGLIGAASATYTNETIVWTTTTVQHLTTYCPEATTLTYGTKTYTATAHETVTITDCDCTISKPVSSTHVPPPPPASSHPVAEPTTTKETHVPIPTTVKTHVPVPTGGPHIPVTHEGPYANTTTLYTTQTHPPVSVTITVSEYTTYCPGPTEIPVGDGSTITVTEATSLTITACPCTLTKPGVVTTTQTQFTTYCPEPTTLTIGTVTHTLPAGTVTIPVEHITTIPAPEPTAPVETHPAPPAETHPAPPAETHPAPPAEADQCVEKCDAAYNACRTAPDANRSYCASQYSSCLGYAPFDAQGSLVTPTACSSQPAATEPVQTTVQTQIVPGTTAPAQTQPITTPAPTFVGTGVSSYLPAASTSSLLQANGAAKRDTSIGALVLAGVVAAML